MIIANYVHTMYYLLFYFKSTKIFMSSALDNSNCAPLNGTSLNNLLIFLV